MNLQTKEQFFASSIEDYLDNSYAMGVKFKINNMSANSIRMFIQGGILLDDNMGRMALQAECRLPEKELYRLLHEQLGNPYKEIDDTVQKNRSYREAINVLMQDYPHLKDASLSMDSETIFNYLYLEGRPAHQAVAYLLNFSNISTPMLRDMLVNKIGLNKDSWDQPMNRDIERLKDLLQLMPDVNCKYGAERLYFFEKGKLGYATVHPDRSVKWFGEEPSSIARKHINKVASKANLLYLNNQFFKNTAVGRVNMLMADKDTERFRDIYIQKYDDGQNVKDVLMEDGVALEKGIPENLISMKGRITQVQFTERADTILMRCRIDGKQQMYEPVKQTDYSRYQKGDWDEYQLAAKYFVGQFLSMQEEQSRSMKR